MKVVQDNSLPDRDEQAALWCLSFAEGELNIDDRAAFYAWSSEPENARAFEEATRVWNAMEHAADEPEIIQMRSAALEKFRKANHGRWTANLARRWQWIGGVAAVLLIVLFTGVTFYRPGQVFTTGTGERRIAVLEDGSRLSLDADSEVKVTLSGSRRDLTLIHGRAKFDVSKDSLRPFTVTAGDKIIVATGTSFSVELLNERVHVLLYEGHVAVLDKASSQPVLKRSEQSPKMIAADAELKPGRELIAPMGGRIASAVSNTDLARAVSWEFGQLSFDDEDLVSAASRVNRYSAEKVEISGEDTAQLRVNGVFTAGDTQAFVEGISALNPLIISHSPGKITVRINRSAKKM